MVQKRVKAAKLHIYYEVGGQDLRITEWMHRSEGTVNDASQTDYTRVCEHNVYCEKFQSQPVKIQQIDGQTICRSRRTSLQHKRTIRMWSSVYMECVY